MQKIKNILSKTGSEEICLLAALVLSGGFNEYISCLISVVAAVFLIVKIAKNRDFKVSLGIVSISVMVLAVGYLLSAFYAVDSGAAFIGFLKFLPIVLYMLLLMQNGSDKNKVIARLPYFALILGAVSFIFMFIPVLSDYFVVSDRLAGFFQYPNTFALFLLVGELVALSKQQHKVFDYVTIALLIIFILLTGSRAVFVFAVLSNAVMLFCKKGWKVKAAVLITFAVLIASYFLLSPLLKDNEFFGRFYAFSLSESTFAGRLLYYADALPVIFKNPFGLGYMGYYNIQQSIQTGIYSVKYIHNDFLQLMLDIGFIFALPFVVGIIKTLFGKTQTIQNKIILMVIVLHSLFDFDLQFTAMFFILLLFLDYDTGKSVEIKKSYGITIFASGFFALLSLYFAVALGLSYFGAYEASNAMYPLNTENKVSLMLSKDTIEEQNEIADEILSQNEYVQVAYSAKARYSFSQGDFESLIQYKQKIFELAPFSYDEYEEYCYMLIQGMYLYQQIGDEQSADYCKQQLVKTSQSLSALESRLSDLGKQIDDQPQTSLPDDVAQYIKECEEEQ